MKAQTAALATEKKSNLKKKTNALASHMLFCACSNRENSLRHFSEIKANSVLPLAFLLAVEQVVDSSLDQLRQIMMLPLNMRWK